MYLYTCIKTEKKCGGHLELWDQSDNKRQLVEKIAPSFNRCVIFETNEKPYHDHPQPLKTTNRITRKSLAAYYYTQSRPSCEIIPKHNTKFINT